MLTFGSLFSGVGGLDLGFERAGLRCVWQVEKEEFCRKVLRKHWPVVPQWDDVTTFTGEGFERPDVIAGGFPCQDLSLAGKRGGLEGERSGLWWEFARIIRILRPRYVVIENVPGIAIPVAPGRPAPLGCVLGELARLGFDAEWSIVSARSVGSTQLRKRIFIIAWDSNLNSKRFPRWPTQRANLGQGRKAAQRVCMENDDSDADCIECNLWPGISRESVSTGSGGRSEADRPGSPFIGSGWWGSEPTLDRMVYGIPRRLARDPIRALGNAVVPQVAEVVAHRLLQIHATLNPEES